MAKATPVNMKANVKDFPRLAKRLAQLQAELDADDKMTQKEKDAKFESVLGHYTGPMTGLVWDSDNNKISIASGFHADENGNVVKN